jgi:hypothetical protein
MIQRIGDLEDAIDFLEGLRRPVNGTVHETALKACYRAASGLMTVENARRAFVSFAKISRLLEDIQPDPWLMRAEGAAGGDASV